jgi:hypothetical protein
MVKLLISFTTYPRKGETYGLLENTFKSLMLNQDLTHHTIKIIVVGDDYPNIDELKPIFNNFDTEFYNINVNDALRNYNISREIKWKQSVQRSKIFILEKALTYDFDYILMSSDDDIYINNKLTECIDVINTIKPDFIFSQGYYIKNKVIPGDININYPMPGNCISSGCLYNLRNIDFINTIIDFRKQKWQEVIDMVNKKKVRILPEDYQLWQFLMAFFKSQRFIAHLIPKILVNHMTEKTLFNYI